MATVRQRGTRWQAVVRLKGRPSRSRTFASQDEATEWAERLERRLKRRGLTLAEALDRFTSDPDVRLSSQHRTVLAWWRKELGHRVLASLKRSDVVSARDRLRRLPSRQGGRLAPATINWRVQALSAAISYCQQRDWCEMNPARIRRLPERNERERVLSDAERVRLLDACRASSEPQLLLFVLAALSSAARAGELQRLRWRDVDLERGVARLLKTKSGRKRAIPLRGPVLALLRDQARGQPPDRHVFVHADGSAPFEYRRSWERARAQAGVPDVRLHDLRHQAATALAQAGASQRELMEVLGHASPAMTARYSHVIDSHLDELGDRLVARMFGADGSGAGAQQDDAA